MTTPTVASFPEAGSALPVHAVTGENVGGPALPVYVVNDRPTLGQKARRVKVIADSDLRINGGQYWLEGRPFAIPVIADLTGNDEGNVPIPVYVVHGSLNPNPPHWSTLGGTIAPSHIAAWTPKGAASLAASYVQYGTLGTGLTVGVAPTLNNGWLFDGSTQYLDTGIIPINTQVQSVGFVFSGFSDTTLYQSPFGSRTAPSGRSLEMTIGTTGDNETYYANGNLNATPGRVASGVVIIAGNSAYLNGVLQTTVGAWTGTSLYTMYLGCLNNAGAAAQFAGITMVAFVYYDIALTAPQVASLNTAMGAL